MKDYIIRPNNYTNLNETLSEKNIINWITGSEYVVTEIKDDVIDTRTIIPFSEQTSYYPQENPYVQYALFNKSPFTNNNTKYNENIKVGASRSVAGLFDAYKSYARTEILYDSGEYEFTVQDVVFSDENSVSCKFEINYIKFKEFEFEENEFNMGTITIPYRTVFHTAHQFPYNGVTVNNETEGVYYYFDNTTSDFQEVNLPEDYIQDSNIGSRYYLKETESDGFLETNFGEATANAYLFPDRTIEAIIDTEDEYCRAKIIAKDANSFKVKVQYKFKVWNAWSEQTSESTTYPETRNEIYVRDIKIITTINTVDTTTQEFEYFKNENFGKKKYELETNELFQIELGEQDENKLSYKTYEEITKYYDTDRRVITFDLINPVKTTFDDSINYTSGSVSERYLDTNDEFSIYNEHNQYIGDFRVIQSNPVWDGSYHKIITAIMLDDSEN